MCEADANPQRKPEGEGPVSRYALLVTTNDTALHCAVVALLDDDQQSEPLQTWHVAPDQTTPLPRTPLTQSAAEHGWTLPAGRWPRFAKGQLTLHLTPQSWPIILAEATRARVDAVERVRRLEAGWHAMIGDADLPVIKIGELVGLTRHRVYQIRET